MTRIKNLVSVVLAATFVLFASSRADAAFEIYAQQDGGAITLLDTGTDFGTAIFDGTFGDFTIEIFGAASDNTASLSDLLSSTTSVTNNSGAQHTLTLYVSQTNYTLPAGTPLSVESGLGGTQNTGTVNLTGIFQAYADSGNNLLGMGDFTNGPQDASLTGSTFDTGSAVGLFDRTGNYSLTSVTTLVLSGGANVNYSNHINVTAVPIPEPGSMMLLGTGLFGLAAAARRRMKGAAK